MKILVLNATDPATLGSSYARAFKELGHEVVQYDPAVLLSGDPLYRNRYSRRLLERVILARQTGRLLQKIMSFGADLIWVGKGQWALPGLWKSLKAARPETMLINYNSDDPVTTYSRGANAPWVTDSISCFDLFCTFKPDIVQDLKKRGAKEVAVIPFAWDEKILPRAPFKDLIYDVLFLANGDNYRKEILAAMLSDPRTKDWRFGIFGSWSRSGHARLDALIKPMPFKQAAIPGAMASAVVSLNILRKQNITSHNLRTFEIPGAGGLSLSQFTEEQNRFFPKDISALYFGSPEQAVSEILRVKNNPELRIRMIERAEGRVREHTFAHRASELLGAVSALSAANVRLPKLIKSGEIS